MGNLTNDMTRLRGEIDALRSVRGAQRRDLVATVSAMLTGFDAAHTAMAIKNRRDRVSYVSGIKKQVSKMRKENADDLNGARIAWHGHDLKRLPKVQMKKEREIVEPKLPPVVEVAKEKEREAPQELHLGKQRKK